MDISGIALNSYQNSSKRMSAVATSVLAKTMDQQEMQGAMTAKMIASAPSPSLESLANPSVGKNIDMTV
ncbi:MAG: YjfB family protein [Pseudobutyrivibrio sp.]|nr:YjfB family protein [Pseudobutyrivibrio sp.]